MDAYGVGNRIAFNKGMNSYLFCLLFILCVIYSVFIKSNELLFFDFDLVLAAFEKLGLDCASWNEPVYSDLLRCFFFCYLLDYFLAYACVLMEKVMTHLDFMSSC